MRPSFRQPCLPDRGRLQLSLYRYPPPPRGDGRAARRAQLLQTSRRWRALTTALHWCALTAALHRCALTAARVTCRRHGQLAAQTACLHKSSHPRLLPAAAHRFSHPALLPESRQAGFPAQDARLQEVFVRSRTALQNFPPHTPYIYRRHVVRRMASPLHEIFSANC